MNNPGLILNPKRERRLAVSLATEEYIVPAHIDRRPEMLPPSNQGVFPHCAAYAMAGVLEYHNWKWGTYGQIDPLPIYKRAKEIDGLGGGDGTTLEAVLQAAQVLGLMHNLNPDSVREVSSPNDVKQALHRYGVLLAAFAVTDEWSYAQPDGWIPDGGRNVGGHAVCLVGYSTAETPHWYGIQNSWGGQGWRGFNRLTEEQFRDQFQYALCWQPSR
ncbi:MAG: hypothetical protein A2Y38_07990 [Spirochaetes bacterium GWB1_59_5]|nr:MAG: hypothetical protein A2Y38_07990 [Spirochaetes bacterium GWB1_59_5]